MVTPPVGMNRTPGNGAASALTIGAPPSCSAGKNLTVSRPASSAIWISVAVATPGKTGTPSSWQRRTTRGAEAGADDERGARVDGRVDLRRGQHGAGADQQVGAAAMRPDRVERRAACGR